MPKYFLSVAFLVLNYLSCFSQNSARLPGIGKEDLPDATFSPERVFKGKALFGYIDGGAELYLEYSFTEAVVTEINYRELKYKLEVFQMNGPEEAFGIYSVSKFNCKGEPSVSFFSCQTKYQLQICKGRYYISIINGSGTQQDSINMLAIGKIIADKINEPDPDLTVYLPSASEENLKKNCFLAKGRLGIVNGSPELEDYFAGIEDYVAVIMNISVNRVISVKFKTQKSLQDFLKLHNWNPAELSSEVKLMPGGEHVKMLAKNHLYITV